MKKTGLIIWDLDGVLFPYTPECLEAITLALADAAVQLDTSLTRDAAEALARQSQALHRNHFTLFIQRGMAFDPLVKACFAAIDLGFLHPDPQLIKAFEHSNASHAILTRSDKPWVIRILERLELGRFFPDNHIFATDNDPAMDKAASPHPYKVVLERTGFTADETVMVEDTPKNLVHAHALGLTTTLITHGKEITNPSPDHIDMISPTPLAFLASIASRSVL